MNRRNRLKAAIAARILQETGIVVDKDRNQAIDEKTEFPIVLLYSRRDQFEQLPDLETYDTKPTVHVVVMTSGGATADDDLDDLCSRIEDALIQPMAPLVDSSGPPVQQLRLLSTDIQPHEKARHVLVGVMEWEAEARVDVPGA